MDLMELGKKIEAMLDDVNVKYEPLGTLDEDGGIWGYEVDEEISGFIRCQYNEVDVDTPVVSIAISLGDLNNFDREDLLGLLEMNGMLIDMHIVATPELGENQFLLLQRTLRAIDFKTEDFEKHVQDLVDVMDDYFE